MTFEVEPRRKPTSFRMGTANGASTYIPPLNQGCPFLEKEALYEVDVNSQLQNMSVPAKLSWEQETRSLLGRESAEGTAIQALPYFATLMAMVASQQAFLLRHSNGVPGFDT